MSPSQLLLVRNFSFKKKYFKKKLINLLTIVRSWGGNKDLPKLELTLSSYKQTHTSVQFDPTVWSDSIENKIFENYRAQFEDFSKETTALEVVTDDMIEHYLNKSKEYLARVNNRYLFGATIEKSNITVSSKKKIISCVININ